MSYFLIIILDPRILIFKHFFLVTFCRVQLQFYLAERFPVFSTSLFQEFMRNCDNIHFLDYDLIVNFIFKSSVMHVYVNVPSSVVLVLAFVKFRLDTK